MAEGAARSVPVGAIAGGDRALVTDPARIRKRLARIRRDGYAWTDQELDLEVNGLATPILDSAGTAIAVATLYGPSYRFAEQLDPTLGAQFAALVLARTALVSR